MRIQLFATPCLALITCAPVRSQVVGTSILNYDIRHNQELIGTLTITRCDRGDTVTILSQAHLLIRLIARVNVSFREETKLVRSTVVFCNTRRKMNGREKVNLRCERSQGGYIITDEKSSRVLKPAILRHTFLSLISEMPGAECEVLAENIIAKAVVRSLSSAHYRVELREGNTMDYFYSHGICRKVIIRHRLYGQITMILKNEDVVSAANKS